MISSVAIYFDSSCTGCSLLFVSLAFRRPDNMSRSEMVWVIRKSGTIKQRVSHESDIRKEGRKEKTKLRKFYVSLLYSVRKSTLMELWALLTIFLAVLSFHSTSARFNIFVMLCLDKGTQIYCLKYAPTFIYKILTCEYTDRELIKFSFYDKLI